MVRNIVKFSLMNLKTLKFLCIKAGKLAGLRISKENRMEIKSLFLNTLKLCVIFKVKDPPGYINAFSRYLTFALFQLSVASGIPKKVEED